MIRTIFAGKAKFQIPAAWAEFRWRERRYRLVGASVEYWSDIRQRWLPSIRLTTCAPKGRVGA